VAKFRADANESDGHDGRGCGLGDGPGGGFASRSRLFKLQLNAPSSAPSSAPSPAPSPAPPPPTAAPTPAPPLQAGTIGLAAALQVRTARARAIDGALAKRGL
jgi:hypothetical protein